MTSIFSVAIFNKELEDEALLQLLNDLAPELFMPIYEVPDYKKVIKPILLYIIHAYSRESNKALLNTTWSKNKSDIATLVGLPDYVYDDVVQLNSLVIRKVILEYLELQGDRDFKYLQMQKDFYDKAMAGAFENITDDDDKIDFKVMKERRSMLADMYQDILKLEEKINDQNVVITFNKEELQKLDEKQSDPGIESSKHIRK